MRKRNALVVLGIAAFAAILAVVAFRPGMNGKSAMEIGGPFRLTSSRGGDVDSKNLIGTPYAIFFGFTHCPEVCPTTLYEMSGTLAKLGREAKDFRVFFVTVDPARDTVAAMRDYIANFDPRIESLVPTEAQLPKLASDFRVFYAKVPTSDGGYTMDHTATTFLFDADGKFAGTIAFGEAAEVREAKLRRLLDRRN
jgi:protein SCO1/2